MFTASNTICNTTNKLRSVWEINESMNKRSKASSAPFGISYQNYRYSEKVGDISRGALTASGIYPIVKSHDSLYNANICTGTCFLKPCTNAISAMHPDVKIDTLVVTCQTKPCRIDIIRAYFTELHSQTAPSQSTTKPGADAGFSGAAG